MAQLAALSASLPAISAALSVGSTIVNTSAQEDIAKIEASQYKQQSIADTALSIQEAKQEKKRAELLKSRATSLAAKSGTSGMDIERAITDIDQQGQYNALAALYSGATSAASKKYAAQAAIARGKSQKASGALDIGSTILTAASDYYG